MTRSSQSQHKKGFWRKKSGSKIDKQLQRQQYECRLVLLERNYGIGLNLPGLTMMMTEILL